MITYRFRTKTDEALKRLDAPRAGVWIDVSEITEEDVGILVKRHGLDADFLNDARDFFEAPRFEYEDGIAYLFSRYPETMEGENTTAPILVAAGPSFVLTVVSQRPVFLDKAASSKHIFTTQKTKLFLQLLSTVTTEYTRVITKIRRDVRRQRMHVSSVTEKTIEQSVHFEYTLNEYVSALVPTNIALSRALTSKHFELYEEDEDLLEDVQLANNQVIETAKSTLKTIQNLRDAHSTIVSNRLNKTVKTLTVLTILLTIPTIVASLYGMNVPVPGGSNPYAFILIVVAIIIAMALAWYAFLRNRWL